MRSIYLDHAATTPMRQEAYEAMIPYLTEKFGNPSSIHAFGRAARKDVDGARERVAKALNAAPQEIFFTSGGTEADNMAILGTAAQLRDKGKHIITSAVEHHAVLHTCEALATQGYRLTMLPVDKYGMVSPSQLAKAITDETILVSIMHANNEVGTIQPIRELAAIAHERGALFHTDAVQSLGNIPVDVADLQVDLLSASAHKLYGPKGVGLLYVRKGTKLGNIAYGGAQERNLRPGTENVAGIMGFARALELAAAEQPETYEHLAALRDKLIKGLTSLPAVSLNGHPQQRLPGNVNVSIERVEGESLILSLDMAGIAVSSGSACTSGSLEPSHVLMAMGLSHQKAHGSLRFTLGKSTSAADIDYVLEVIPGIIQRLRQMSPVQAGQE
ncbi:MAG: cysteine desulfurase NifS [Eubacteriales bacterium]|jgi:cysteine desulfurase|nr:cysteine desulfurase NifS [Eubacteriales bacterium]